MITNNKLNYLIIFLFMGMWISIGSDPYDYLIIFEDNNYKNSNFFKKINLLFVINFLRSSFPYFVLIISIFVILKYKIFKEQNKFIYILFLIQIVQLITTIISKNSLMSNFEIFIDHIGRYHWVISSLSTIFIFMIAHKLKNFKFKQFFYVSTFFIVLMTIFFTTKILIDFYSIKLTQSVYHLDVLRESAYFFDHQIPRTTGLSRSILFLYLILFLFKDKFINYLKYINYFFLIILGSLIFFFQSKFAILSYFILNFIFIYNAFNKKGETKLILALFISHIFLFYSISSSRIIYNKVETYLQNNKDLVVIEKEKSVKHFRSFDDKNFKSKSEYIQNVISSGRINIWKKTIIFIKKRPFLGYGSMSDRHIINEQRLKNRNIVNPVSNAFLYSLISGGILSFFLFFYFWLTIYKNIINILKIKTISSYYEKIATLIIFILALRCLVENSVMLFGVDFLLLLNALYLIERK